ncbi:MAG: hypothetical protein A2029_16155 [Chloroflexi bacterium RBG_19FT_COMBO_47_9]|nr:MAG: hypothetical protein A2029_16155 [Chloroflexi bacterium RBG_19FT_COMBO_47_9]
MNAPGKFRVYLELICEVLWAIALICLPITTFPLFSSLTGALVAPLSILPFFLLLLLWVIPLIFRKGNLPKETIPLGFFVLFAILSCAVAYFLYIPGFKGKSIPGQEIRAFFTLMVGLTFYLVTTTWVRSIEKLKNTWKYLTIGGILSLVWTGIQAFFILKHADLYPPWLDQVQSWFVVLSPAFSARHGRVNGLTYEASWFAHQMVLIYLPLWLAATYHKTSAFKFRFLNGSIENILLIFGFGAFFLSSPRIGLISFFLVVVYFFYRLNLRFHRRLVDGFSKQDFFRRNKSSSTKTKSLNYFSGAIIILIYILLAAGIFFVAIQRDWRLSILVSEPPSLQEITGILTLDQDTLLDLSHRFIFLERMVYWFNGWNSFSQYPWLGVGLGNSGFFFPQFAPAMGWASYEIRNVLFYLPMLPNIKSFWFRLLAETGLAGFSIFLSWFYVLFQSSRFSHHHQDATMKTFALAGQLALLAFIGEGFSIDSFAMPYFWVIAGLIAGIAMIFRRELINKPNTPC